jgi:hypothetical protein
MGWKGLASKEYGTIWDPQYSFYKLSLGVDGM